MDFWPQNFIFEDIISTGNTWATKQRRAVIESGEQP